MDVHSSSLLWICLSVCFLVSASEVQTNITAEPGDTVTLTCRAPADTIISAVEWTRPELELPGYVFLYRDSQSDPENQHPSFKKRTELKDKQMKDGDVSLILNNVTVNDTGRYECHVWKETKRRKRSSLNTEPIWIINLTVQPDRNTTGHVGLIVSLSVTGVIAAVVGFMIFMKCKKHNKKNSHLPPADETSEQQLV